MCKVRYEWKYVFMYIVLSFVWPAWNLVNSKKKILKQRPWVWHRVISNSLPVMCFCELCDRLVSSTNGFSIESLPFLSYRTFSNVKHVTFSYLLVDQHCAHIGCVIKIWMGEIVYAATVWIQNRNNFFFLSNSNTLSSSFSGKPN